MGDDTAVERAADPSSTEPASPRTDVVNDIADLSAITLRGIDLPEVPDGLDELDVLTAADTLRAMAVDAFTNRVRWSAKPSDAELRTHLAIGGPDLYEQIVDSPVLEGPAPRSQAFLSTFDSTAQPLEQPRVVKAAWDVEEVDGATGRVPVVTLEVQALYSVGDVDDPRAILVRRTTGLGGNEMEKVDTERTWFTDVQIIGADDCRFWTAGIITPGEQSDVEGYEEFLADAQVDEPLVPFGETTSLADRRAEACG